MKVRRLVLLFVVCFAASYALSSYLNSRKGAKSATIVILSTNDMHAQIKSFPLLATAIAECRDTAEVILVDAGDRWTGNAYVDRVENYAPIYELMNYLDYDLTIYGNHEFDKGQAYLAESNKLANFEIIGANITSDTSSFAQPAAYTIVEKQGIKIAFVGVTGNYTAGGHPDGFADSYAGLTFSDPLKSAAKYSYLKDEADLLILITHNGLERDLEFVNSANAEGYDMVIGGHSHSTVDTVINGKVLAQTGSRLKNIGATVVKRDTKGNITLDYRNVPLANYVRDSAVNSMVEGYYNNPELDTKIATIKEGKTINAMGISNLFLTSISEATGADVVFYNEGGVRLSELPSPEISVATILNMEPFNNKVAQMTMTTAQMQKMILAKFNDTINIGESHCIDLVCSVPYTVVTDSQGEGVRVDFSTLSPSKEYSVAMGSYIYSTYSAIEATGGEIVDILVADAIENYLRSNTTFTPNNKPLQSIN